MDSGNVKHKPRQSLTYLSANYPAVRRLPRCAGLSPCAQRRQLHAQFLLSAGTEFDAVVFTNLGHDHLDLHGSQEEYFRAMARIEGRETHERDRDVGEVSAVFEEAQLFDAYDQELHEHAATLCTVAARTD